MDISPEATTRLRQQAADGHLPARQRLSAHYILAPTSEASLDAARAEALRQAQALPTDPLPLMVAAALEATRAKFSIWPHKQLAFAQAGIRAMDDIIERFGPQWALLYVRAAVSLHLPFFFGKQEQAKADIRALGHALATVPPTTEDIWLIHAAHFVQRHAHLAGMETEALAHGYLPQHLATRP